MDAHEMYCAGHLIEAGIAYLLATGDRTLLDVGVRMVDHMSRRSYSTGCICPPGGRWCSDSA